MEYRVRIEQDDICGNGPRDWDNLGTMICFHSQYSLGDKHDYIDPEHFILALWEDFSTEKEKRTFILETCKGDINKFRCILEYGYTDIDILFEYCVDEFGVPDYFPKDIYILPLFLYDHGGITMNTCGFTCRWDSGQVGYIYVSKEDIKKEGLSDRTTEEILGYLKGEVKTYDQFITGDVYGYTIEEAKVYTAEDGDTVTKWNHVDSCWGIYGRDECEAEAQTILKGIEERAKVFPTGCRY